MKNHRKELYVTDMKGLARIVDFSKAGEVPFPEEELGAVWKHQLDAPLNSDLDLSRLELKKSRRADDAGEVPVTFGELLRDKNPPLELLCEVKDFGKNSWTIGENALPKEIGTVLYFAAVAAAMQQCDASITSLSRRQMRRGLKWCTKQKWLDAETRALLKNCAGSVAGPAIWPFSRLFG